MHSIVPLLCTVYDLPWNVYCLQLASNFPPTCFQLCVIGPTDSSQTILESWRGASSTQQEGILVPDYPYGGCYLLGIAHLSTFLTFPRCCVWYSEVGTFLFSELKIPQVLKVLHTSFLGNAALYRIVDDGSDCVLHMLDTNIVGVVHVSLCQNCHSLSSHSWYKHSKSLIATLCRPH